MITGGDVKAPVAAARRLHAGGGIGDIAIDALEIQAIETAQIGRRTEERPDAMSAGNQFVDQICADESGGAGDKTIHVAAARD